MGMESWPDDRTGTDGRTHAEFTSDEFNIDYFLIDCSVERLYESLDGRSVAIVLSSGPFLPQWWYCNGHFVVVYKQQDGLFFVQDPASDTPNTIYNEDEMRQLLSNSPRTLLLKRR